MCRHHVKHIHFCMIFFLFTVLVSMTYLRAQAQLPAVSQPAMSHGVERIVPFEMERDKAVVRALIEKDRHYLISSDDFSYEDLFAAIDCRWVQLDVMYVGSEMVGFVAYDVPCPWKARVVLLAVDQRYRRCGYGTRLLNYVMKIFKKYGIPLAYLVVKSENRPAQAVYATCGFKPAGTKDVGKHGVSFLRKI